MGSGKGLRGVEKRGGLSGDREEGKEEGRGLRESYAGEG